ncbi:MAG: orotate phosphoribosyltransferase [Clostridiales bacterium]|jgi:orotate phosphoribosyltransferase|nr:orotate phosphoribosyltransferase [Clostridiales bacterium]
MIAKEEAEKMLVDAEALLIGHFILTSGKHSDRYMQCAKLLQYPQKAEIIAKELAGDFRADGAQAVIGPALGGVIIAYELARQLNVKNMFAERENGKMTLRRGFELEKGMNVIVAEDVITTGGSVKEVMDLVRATGANVAGVCAIVDRSMGKVDFGVKTRAVYTAEINAWDAEDCPLCARGGAAAIKPGSRGLERL